MTAIAMLAGAAALYAALLGRARRGEASPRRRWWQPYVRDGVHLLGNALYAAGFALLGLPGPAAVVAAVALGLFTYGADRVAAWAAGRGAPVLVAVASATAATAMALGQGILWPAIEGALEVAAPR